MVDFLEGERLYLKIENGLIIPVIFVRAMEKAIIVAEEDGDELMVKLSEVAKYKKDLTKKKK